MFERNSLTELLAAFFYRYGYLSIPELGRFDLSDKALPDVQAHAHHTLPRGSILFSYDPREPVDPALIDFITASTRKMKALAVSDLDSLADLAKEMINLGQSYTLKGIATLKPGIQGDMEVIPDRVPVGIPQDKTAPAEMFHRGTLNPVINEGKIHAAGSRRTAGGIVIATACAVIAGLLIYFLFFHHKTSGEPAAGVHENEATVLPAPANDSVNTKGPAAGTGTLHYQVVFEQAGRERALQRYKQLTGWGHTVILHTRDSVRFTLAVPVTSPAADTAAVKDSIHLLYGHPVYIRY